MIRFRYVYGGQEELNAAIAAIESEGGVYLDLKVISNQNFILVYSPDKKGESWYSKLFSSK